MPDTRFIVVQIGARHGYAIPAILDQAGLLERFYTELCGTVGAGRYLAMARFVSRGDSRAARLAARRLPDGIAGKTRTFARPVARHAWRSRRLDPGDAAGGFRENLRFSDELGEAMARAGYGAATHVYGMMGECGPFLARASRRGLRVISEVYIPLSTERILAEERRAFPDWEPEVPDYAALRREAGAVGDALLRWTDHFICPSPRVRDDLVANFGVGCVRTSVVPYGVEPRWFDVDPRPVPRRVLFAGAACLRKGIHYLAMAAERLRAGGCGYEFRVAGEVTPRVAAQPPCRHLTFLGRVPRARMCAEFEAADVLVLPSLAEGSATVTHEALAAGVPVVTTRAAGSPVRDGIEGRIVPERDPAALADAIAEIVGDRDRRARMSAAARRRAGAFTWDRYGERLVAALRSSACSSGHRGQAGPEEPAAGGPADRGRTRSPGVTAR